jgi:hypothetical protein
VRTVVKQGECTAGLGEKSLRRQEEGGGEYPAVRGTRRVKKGKESID